MDKKILKELKNLENISKKIVNDYSDIKNSINKKIDEEHYKYILLQIIQSLEENFGIDNVKEIIDFEEIDLENKKIVVKNPQQIIFLWNKFFETLFFKKKYKWLEFLESLVINLSTKYSIKIPDFYNYKILNFFEENKSLKKENINFLNSLINSEKKLFQIELSKIKDIQTDFYNKNYFLSEFSKIIKRDILENKPYGLLFLKINRPFSLFINLDEEALVVTGISKIIKEIWKLDENIFRLSNDLIMIYYREKTNYKIFLNNLSEKIENEFSYSKNISVVAEFFEIKELDSLNKYHAEMAKDLIEMVELKFRIFDNEFSDASNYIEKENNKNKNILIVESEEANQVILKNNFINKGYNVLISETTMQALKTLENQNVDIIISALKNSKIDGFEIRKYMLNNKSFKNIGFVLLDAKKDEETIKQAFELKICHYIKKPYFLEEVSLIVENFLCKEN